MREYLPGGQLKKGCKFSAYQLIGMKPEPSQK